MKSVVIFTAFLASSSAAFAGQAFDSAAIITGVQKTQTHVIGEGHVILQILSEYESIMATDTNSPIHGLTGGCFGAVEIAGANATGGGNCVFSNSDGDMIANSWSAMGFTAEGALVGTWVNTGGSGKFSGISGGGTFSSLTDNATGKFRNTITGASTLP